MKSPIMARPATSQNGNSRSANGEWLPDMDLNHDKQIQSLLCYRYTIGQTSALKVERPHGESRLVGAPGPENRRAQERSRPAVNSVSRE